jgi:hypothetical protein
VEAAGNPRKVLFELVTPSGEPQALIACEYVTLDIVGGATHFLTTNDPTRVAELIFEWLL